jgi:hypothetical protein
MPVLNDARDDGTRFGTYKSAAALSGARLPRGLSGADEITPAVAIKPGIMRPK